MQSQSIDLVITFLRGCETFDTLSLAKLDDHL